MVVRHILLLGLGDLGSQVFDLLVRLPGANHFLVCGRNEEELRKRSNVSLFTAMQLGYSPIVSYKAFDVCNSDQTAEIIADFQPDLIFCAIAVQPWLSIKALPPTIFERLYQAMAGPWLPWSLTLQHRIMQAVRRTGLAPKVVNAAYPDAVNTVLSKVDLAPTTGIGNIANNIPALKKAIALELDIAWENVDVYFVAPHYVSHKISRIGSTGGAPFHLTVIVDGDDVTSEVNVEHVFDLLSTTFSRSAKGAGQLVTAASASVVVEGILKNSNVLTHAPGPTGLPGGYPVRVDAQGVEVILPAGLSLESAIEINEAGLRLDGIEKIEEDGTVHFAEKNMSILKEVLGYECKMMRLAEVGAWAEELQAKYREAVDKYRS